MFFCFQMCIDSFMPFADIFQSIRFPFFPQSFLHRVLSSQFWHDCAMRPKLDPHPEHRMVKIHIPANSNFLNGPTNIDIAVVVFPTPLGPISAPLRCDGGYGAGGCGYSKTTSFGRFNIYLRNGFSVLKGHVSSIWSQSISVTSTEMPASEPIIQRLLKWTRGTRPQFRRSSGISHRANWCVQNRQAFEPEILILHRIKLG